MEESIQQIAAIGFGAFDMLCQCGVGQHPRPGCQGPPPKGRGAGCSARAVCGGCGDGKPAPSAGRQLHQAALVRMREAIELGRDLAPGQKPLVQTVLGGGKWDEVKSMLRDRVGEWAQLAQEQSATICIKPHRFGAIVDPRTGCVADRPARHPDRGEDRLRLQPLCVPRSDGRKHHRPGQGLVAMSP